MKSGTKTVLACAVIFTVSFALTGLVMGVGEGASGYPTAAAQTEAVQTADASETAAAAVAAVTAGTESAERTGESPAGGYIVCVYGGKVAVFYGDFQTVPAIETNISVEDLRSADRQLLEAGIRVPEYEDVVKLLEDFNS